MEVFWDCLWDALKDTAFIVPILYLAYLIVSYFSHNGNEKYSKILHKTNKAGPVIGSVLGCVPQCGFSSVMSQLYSKRIVTLGTLIAVFVATSDEAIPLMISKPEFIPKLLIMIAIKVVYAIIVGYLIDGIIRLFKKKKQNFSYKKTADNKKITNRENEELHQHEHEAEHHNESEDKDEIDETLAHENACCCGHKHEHQCHHPKEEEGGHEHSDAHCCARNIFLDALIHTAIITAYVFVATLAINLITGYCGSLDPLKTLFTENHYIQILLASVIGLIPNCAASVFLVELFMEGVLIFPALVAGLTAGAGVGLIVLFTSNYKKIHINLSIIGIQYALAIIIGVIINFIPIW